MASIVWKRGTLLESLVDIAGFKAGLVLSVEEVKRALPDQSALLEGDHSVLVRTRAEEFDGIVQSLLYALGAATASEPASPMDLYAKYYPDRRKLDVYNAVGDMVGKITMAHLLSRKSGPIDLTGLIPQAQRGFGDLGAEIAKDWCRLAHRATNESAWSAVRYIDWKDKAELKSLFTSADLTTSYGTFFDQRFVDYLAQNFDSIDEIHWRQFEGLTAEYFEREGASVKIGPGTNDDGVDVRVWWPGDELNKPAAIPVSFSVVAA